MSKRYQSKLEEILSEDYSLMSKLYLLYELECFTGEVEDEVVDQIYESYLNNKNFNSIYDYVLAIQEWCGLNETPFEKIKDYEKMLREIY